MTDINKTDDLRIDSIKEVAPPKDVHAKFPITDNAAALIASTRSAIHKILHSEDDHRCPLSQAEELFAALRWLGREVELIVFEGEHHGLSRSGRPGNRIERQRRIMAWFDRYLGKLP